MLASPPVRVARGKAPAVPAALVLLVLLHLASAGSRAPGPEPCLRPTEVARDRGSSWVDCNPERSAIPLRGAAPLLFGRRLDVASAPAWALEALPGIGPARARAVVAERVRQPLCAVDDLERVAGIGPVTVARLGGWVTVAQGACSDARRAFAESQKRPQLLSNPCENSYNHRADPALGRGRLVGDEKGLTVRESLSRSPLDPHCGSLCPGCKARALQGGLPSCD